MRRLLPLLLAFTCCLTSCTSSQAVPKDFSVAVLPDLPAAMPTLNVYVVEMDAVVTMDIETYVAGVVAGEMPGDWPLEALKAQAILARTFVVKFVTEKTSRYPGADISTDIAEAQAYDADAVNARIQTAVQDTRGQLLLASDGSLPYTWFHAHSGGQTAQAWEGIDWHDAEPSHISSVPGLDSDDAPDSAKAWTAVFPRSEFLTACREAGSPAATCTEVLVGETGPSGRAVTLLVDGTPVNAARLRIALGSAKMRSTLLTDISVSDKTVTLSGKGYGHGVGMPQWGAYAMARSGRTAQEIVTYYYNEVSLTQAWN